MAGIAALRSKWDAGKARRGSISESIRDRGATQAPAHFHRNPPGRASFGRLLCRSSVEDHSGYSPSSLRASCQNTRRRRYTSHGLGALVRPCSSERGRKTPLPALATLERLACNIALASVVIMARYRLLHCWANFLHSDHKQSPRKSRSCRWLPSRWSLTSCRHQLVGFLLQGQIRSRAGNVA